MKQLLQIEWLKIKKYPAFWWMLGIVTFTYPAINLLFHNVYENITSRKDMAGNAARFLLGNPFAFPDAWHSVAYFSSWFLLVPAILIIMLITNEYQYKTHRQNIIDGWIRDEFITAKLLDVLIVAVIVTVMYTLVAAFLGFYYSDAVGQHRWSEELYFIPLFFLMTFAQLSIAFFTGFIIKKAFIALGIFFFYMLVIENIMKAYFSFKSIPINAYLPFELSNRLVPRPNFLGKIDEASNQAYLQSLSDINLHILYTLIFTGFIWWLCYKTFRKADL
ncbi:MAG: ABC transporter permease [Sphingobacteriales bacterium]|uniref:ABC transporter permease n=1 Tax=Hydrotalea flava TaxID=714549 RepID=UPI00082FE161|nr:ABC transporter permease [Hydrotalea flava]RTL55103.1 MAG: ABC transporter permease [Sphingobacteriales bacterium]